MQIFQDLRTDTLVQSPGIDSPLTALSFKRSPYQLIEWQPGRSPDVQTSSLLDSGTATWTVSGFLTFTADASTDKLTFTSVTDMEEDMRVRIATTSAAPGNLSTGTNYYVVNLDEEARTCQLASTQGGGAIDITSAGTGTHTLVFWPDLTIGIKPSGAYDGDYLALVQSYTADVNRQLYRCYMNLETVQIDALLGHEEPGDGTTFTADAGTDVLTLTDGTELADDDRARVTSTGTLPAGLSANTDYWWDEANSKLLASSGGSVVDITDAGTGTHTITRQPDNTNDVAEITGAMFEVSFRLNPSENEWRPSLNEVSATILHNVNDPDTNPPVNTAAPTEGLALLVDGSNAGAAIQELKGLNLTDATELTVASGAITVTQGYHTVDVEGGVASADDLDTITAAKGAGDVLFLAPENAARVVTLKHGTGNINCPSGADIDLTCTLLLLKTTAGDWDVVATVVNTASVTDGDTLGTGLTFPNTGLHLLDTNGSHDLILAPGSDLTADRTLTLTTGDADRNLTMSGDATISGTNTGDQTIALTGDVTGTGTGSFAATIANKTGADSWIVTGTAGTSDNLVKWNADGDAVDSGIPITATPATQYRTFEIPLSEWAIRGGSPVLSDVAIPNTNAELKAWLFDQASAESLGYIWRVPEDMDVSADVEMKIAWSTSSGGTGDVVWTISSTYSTYGGDGSAMSWSASDESVSFADASGGQYYINIPAAQTLVTSGNVSAGSLVYFTFARFANSGSDTFGSDAALLRTTIRYKLDPDTSGSW